MGLISNPTRLVLISSSPPSSSFLQSPLRNRWLRMRNRNLKDLEKFAEIIHYRRNDKTLSSGSTSSGWSTFTIMQLCTETLRLQNFPIPYKYLQSRVLSQHTVGDEA